MSTSSAVALVTGAVGDYGAAVLTILTAVLGLAVAYLAFKFGWRKIRGAVR